MDNESPFGDVKSRARNLGVHIVHILIDAAFLVLWLALQYGVDYVIKKLELSGIGYWMLVIFQVVFAISTLVPVIIYIWLDISVMVIRAGKKIKQEFQQGNRL